MKTSNIILISYISLMLLYSSTYFIPYHGEEVKYSIRTVKINDFRYLKLMPGTNISFVKDDDNFLEIPVPENIKTPIIYNAKGDTLVIHFYKTPIKYNRIKLHGRITNSLISDSAICYIRINTDSLSISGKNQSSFFFEEASETQVLNAKLSGKSKINAENFRTKYLTLKLKGEAHFSTHNKINKALISLKDNSILRVGKIDSLVLNQEGSNHVYFEGY